MKITWKILMIYNCSAHNVAGLTCCPTQTKPPDLGKSLKCTSILRKVAFCSHGQMLRECLHGNDLGILETKALPLFGLEPCECLIMITYSLNMTSWFLCVPVIFLCHGEEEKIYKSADN